MFTGNETAGIGMTLSILSLMLGMVFGSWVGKTDMKHRLIKCDAAEYRVDPNTGQTSFVIFAEEKASLKETE